MDRGWIAVFLLVLGNISFGVVDSAVLIESLLLY